MAAVAQVAYDLWNAAANGVATVGAAAGAAAFLHGGRFRGLRIPTSALGLLMYGSLVAVTILVMILSKAPDGAGGQRYYSTGRLYVHFEVQHEIIPFPLPSIIVQDGSFGGQTVPGMTKKNPIVLPPPVAKEDVENLAKVTGLIHKGQLDAVSLSEWDSVLKLTGIDAPFDFEKLGEDLRTRAIVAVDVLSGKGEVSAAELLSLGLDHSISQWIACPAEMLARRDEPLTVNEILAIGPHATSVVNKIHYKSLQWVYRQEVKPVNGRQDYPDFWDGVKAGFVNDLAEDKDWLPLFESPCV